MPKALSASPLFRIVQVAPEIPNNTGNIGRTCIATACALDLVRPLGFDTDDHALKRAGLDYWPRLAPRIHPDWDAWASGFEAGVGPIDERAWFFTTKASRPVWDASFVPGDAMVFGSETRGLPEELLERHRARTLTLPMAPNERSLNVATAVCAAIYEGMRQLAAAGVVAVDTEGAVAPAPGARGC